jgi:feruloyl-CoA synthase
MNVNANAAPPLPGTTKPTYRPITYGPVDVVYEEHPAGGHVFRSRCPLEPHDSSMARVFRKAVEARPDRLAIAERDHEGRWRGPTYAEARARADAMAQALLDRGLSAERPVMILSGNSVDHAVLMLAGLTAGVPVAPLSVAYSLQSEDHAKLRHAVRLIDPGLIYVADTAPFAKALGSIADSSAEIVATRNGANLDGVTLLEDLARSRPGPAVEHAVASGGPDTIAKFLFTSGSTGFPKAVVNTHRMLTANQQALAQIWPFLDEDELVLLDWLPWNHTFGGNHDFNLVMRAGGTLHIDAGRPMPALVAESVRNLVDVRPTIYLNVPAGFAAVLPYLENDPAVAQAFFSRLRMILYAGASLPQDLWDRMEALAIRTIGCRIPMTSGWGSTETAPMATAPHYLIDGPGLIGVPVPGIELRLVPNGSKLEVRVRGPHVTPGYWKSPELTAAAFDEAGFYRIGDAVRFVDPADPTRGLVFDGRIAEDFKLATGTWVHVGALRVQAIAAATPVLLDCVVTGENRPFIGLLAWLNAAGCQRLIGAGAPVALPDLARHPTIVSHVRRAIEQFNADKSGSSMRITRVLLLDDAPSIDANEITDKGYVNQRMALGRRAASVERLHVEEPDPAVIVLDA